MKRVIVLGATGSIGVQALEVITASEDMAVVGLSCGSNAALLLSQAAATGCRDVAIEDERVARSLGAQDGVSVRQGSGAAARLAREVEADLILNAIVGFAGLESTLATIESGVTLALANKESLVCAGALVNSSASANNTTILPVDSEHSALFQLIEAAGAQAVESVVITGSGGPLRGRRRSELLEVTKEQALAHPTWSMGPKISIDSATLMNKGLEVIEAHHLFGLAYDRIEVTIHPQSIVHALVRMSDGALLAHMGMPDMKVPIAFALHHPRRVPVAAARLELEQVASLTFEEPDESTFTAVRLSREAGARGDRSTCALNAANEVAVHAFLGGDLGFLGISEVVAEVVGESGLGDMGTYEEAVAVDAWAREKARLACARRRL